MKAKLAYLLLTCGVLILLAVAALLTRSLLEISVSGTEIAALPPAPPLPVPGLGVRAPVGETVIEVGAPEKPVTTRLSTPPPTAQRALPPGDSNPPPSSRPPTPLITRVAGTPTYTADNQPDARGIGRIIAINGTVAATDKDGARRVLTLQSWVFAGDRVDTDRGARVSITFLDGSTLSQGEISSIIMDEYVYDPDAPRQSSFALRFVGGVCRMITGAIAELNPDRFEVRTRMATVGIRGCDLAFRSSQERDDIYVIDLAGMRLVRINTTSDGSRLVNITTGDRLQVDDAKRTVIDITEPNSAVFITAGQGLERKSISLDDIRRISKETSLMPPARPELIQGPDGAVFVVRPEPPARPESSDQPDDQ